MAAVEKTVFISYRRSNAPWALAVFQNLIHYGYDVFYDFNGIASGDFGRIILENIHARAHFLLLLTPSALDRFSEPNDWLRKEVEAALKSERNIVPLMLEGFNYSSPAIAKHLTGELATLTRYNALHVPVEYFDEAMARLREKFLNIPLDAVLHPCSSEAQINAQTQQAAAFTAPPVEESVLTAQKWFELGFQATDEDEKLRCYSEAIRLRPDFSEAYNNRGAVRSDKGDLKGAYLDYCIAIGLDPTDWGGYSNRGNALKKMGDLDGALKDYDEAIRLDPDSAPAHSNRGVTRLEKGDIAGAIEDFEVAIRLMPETADVYFNRGNAQKRKGDLDNALQDFSKAIRLNPNDWDAYYNRGLTRKEKGDLDGALADYDEAIRIDAKNARAYVSRGTARFEKRDFADALQDYEEAIRLDPKNALAYNNRGLLRVEREDLDYTLEDFDHAIRLNPNYASAYFSRGNARLQKGDLDGALADYNEAIRVDPTNYGTYHNRGVSRYKKGDLDGALADYTEAIRLNPDDAISYNSRGVARFHTDLDGALQDFEQVIRLDPKHPTASELRDYLLKVKEAIYPPEQHSRLARFAALQIIKRLFKSPIRQTVIFVPSRDSALDSMLQGLRSANYFRPASFQVP